MSSDIRAIAWKGGAAVTVSDATKDPNGPFAGLVATSAAGVTKVTTIDGSTCLIYLSLGIPFPMGVARVWSTGTSATGITGLYASAGVLP